LKEKIGLLAKLLVLDEIGYLGLDGFGATCLFQLVSERYEHGSMILTSNKCYGDWGTIFSDLDMEVANTSLCNGQNKLADAIRIFQLNVELYPKSWHVYESLGEAYMNHGDKKLAIQSYEKSLELNPQNTNGAATLQKLKLL